MMQQTDVDQNESNELKSTSASGGGGSVFSLENNSFPSTPVARNRFPLVRTGRDSGYGTDYSPSPSSNTSSRHFVFNDEMVAGRNTASSKDIEMLDLSKRLDSIQVVSRNNLDIESDSEDVNEQSKSKTVEFENDDEDDEVKNINSNNTSFCQFGLPEEDKLERPSAPLPGSVDNARNGGPRLGIADIPPVVRPLLLRIEDKTNNVSNTGQVGSASQVEHLSRDRSHSMPNVRTLSEQQVGRELRRLSDDFYNFHCNRRRQRTLSVESSAFPLRVNIDVYAGRPLTDRRTNNDSDNEETNNRHSEV